ncbi:myb-like DNA-binding domain protein [Ichthyophthirius multifiliis]|uniref:Myb-like DNA-binding domain protein n=1 Tax=Ichthyophthirius multifiliis TaxID=5932 RepID=G0R5K3_ICHMU|nr:myb-like DNA-binding domain protein [Ichthyophthirius multifiliis]EGR27263.1 myb-like DNA-binding domain protein [Ichthyophthirius multifiliis]|eukprot:XP_004024147.1 myb-like DNA-binding domain protein [Ichthyophthirius multifiliis]
MDQKLIKNQIENIKKGSWDYQEDEKLILWVKKNGPSNWSLCAETIKCRTGKQCRERWHNNLNPNVKKGNWTKEEDDNIFQQYLQLGSSWSYIAKSLKGRTENSVKNRFYSTVRKMLSDNGKQTFITDSNCQQ